VQSLKDNQGVDLIASREIRVRYLWNSRDFDPHNNFFSRLIESAGMRVKIIEDRRSHADLEIVSVFPPKSRKIASSLKSINQNYPYGVLDYELKAITFKYLPRGNCKRRIWYTGENIRPPLLEDFDFYFSFDQDDFGGKNFYTPLYFQEIGLANFANQVRVQTIGDQKALSQKREKSLRKNFACTFFSNPHPIRLAAIQSLQGLGKVDIFGRAVRKPIQFKEQIARDYKFVICFENDLFPGYVTEKLVDAYKCGAVPLYWGDLGNDQILNRNSFINLRDFSSLADFSRFVEGMSESDYFEMQQAPLLKRYPDIAAITKILTNF
jgi:hypothetical protein